MQRPDIHTTGALPAFPGRTRIPRLGVRSGFGRGGGHRRFMQALL